MRIKVFTTFKRMQDSLKASFPNSVIILFAIIICTGTFVHAASSPSQPSQLTVGSDPIAGTPATPTLGGANLVGYWKFDEGTGPFAVDSSGHGNTGTLANGPTWAAGMSGNALRFDGIDDNVTVFDSNVLDLSNSFTISAWVNPSSTATDFRAVLAKNYKYYLYASGAGFCGDGNPLGGFYEGRDLVACEAWPLPVNAWSHLSVTYDGSTLTFYRNGLVGATAAVSGALSASTGTLQIGASEYGEYFQGLIDEVRVYNKRLSNAEIQSIYQQGAVNLPFDYVVTNSGNQSTYAGSSVTNTIVTALSSGLSQPVSFNVSGLPAGASGSLSFTSCTLNCSTVLNISTGSSTPPGSYLITVTADGGGVKRTTVFTLSIALAGTTAGTVLAATQPTTSGSVNPGTGKIYYVATNGDDAYSCTQAQSQSTPKRTLNAAFSCMASGDTLQVKGGTYSAPTRMPPSGTSWSNATRIRRYGSDIVTLTFGTDPLLLDNKSFQIWDGFQFQGGGGFVTDKLVFFWNGSHHNRFINNHFSQARMGVVDGFSQPSGGFNEIINNTFTTGNYNPANLLAPAIYLQSPNNLIERNDISQQKGYCIQLYTGVGHLRTDNTVVRYNWCHESTADGSKSGGSGLNVTSGNNIQVYGNIFSNNASTPDGGGGVIGMSDTTNAKIYNNTLYNNQSIGITVGGSANSSVIQNNILWQNCRATVVCDWPNPEIHNVGRNTIMSNNLCTKIATGCSIVSNPLFVNPTENNFRLQSGSPARGNGINLVSEGITLDFDGLDLSKSGTFSIGAFE
jgi:hypothetical protein